jgi:hypothetical protein
MRYNMHFIIALIFTILIFPVFAQTGITWSVPITVAGSEYDNLRPRLAADAAGNAMVLWGDGTGDNAYFSKWNGSAFTTPVKINPESADVFVSDWAGPDLASKGDTVYAVYKQDPEDYTPAYIVRSFDGGASFSTPFAVEDIADSISRFPVVAVNTSGNPVVAFMKFNADFLDSRWSVAVSNDYGSTFFVDVRASGYEEDEVCDCCPGSLAIADNTIAMLYRNNKNNYRNMWAGISTNHGISFPAGIPVDDSNWTLNICPSSGPDGVIIADTLYTVFMSGAGGANRVYLSTTSLSNPESSSTKLLAEDIADLNSQNYPKIAHHDSALAIVWKQVVNNDAQIAFLYNDNLQDGFPVGVEVIAASTSNNLNNPDVFISNGKIHVVWQNNANNTIQYISGDYTLTGIQPAIVLQQDIEVYPNPASGILSINIAAESVKLFDLNGQQTDAPYYPASKSIDVTSLLNGMYIMQIQHQQEIRFQKLVIQH